MLLGLRMWASLHLLLVIAFEKEGSFVHLLVGMLLTILLIIIFDRMRGTNELGETARIINHSLFLILLGQKDEADNPLASINECEHVLETLLYASNYIYIYIYYIYMNLCIYEYILNIDDDRIKKQIAFGHIGQHHKNCSSLDICSLNAMKTQIILSHHQNNVPPSQIEAKTITKIFNSPTDNILHIRDIYRKAKKK